YDATLVRPTVRPLLQELLGSGRTDFPDELAWRLPYTIASQLLGVPPRDAGRLFEMAQPLLHYVDHAPVSFDEVIRQREDMRSYMRHAAAHCSGAAAMLRLLTDDGLDEIDVLSNGIQLLIAATETTRTFIVNLLARLASRPDVFAALRADFDTAEGVLNETLRHEPPLHFVLRLAARDLELGGQSIPKGAPIQVCLASANRDPA
ncbi:cytochrome P450, partial [Actinomadura adrarensis]